MLAAMTGTGDTCGRIDQTGTCYSSPCEPGYSMCPDVKLGLKSLSPRLAAPEKDGWIPRDGRETPLPPSPRRLPYIEYMDRSGEP